MRGCKLSHSAVFKVWLCELGQTTTTKPKEGTKPLEIWRVSSEWWVTFGLCYKRLDLKHKYGGKIKLLTNKEERPSVCGVLVTVGFLSLFRSSFLSVQLKLSDYCHNKHRWLLTAPQIRVMCLSEVESCDVSSSVWTFNLWNSLCLIVFLPCCPFIAA